MRIFIARHGQTAWNAEGRAQGHQDVPLDAVGREQAAALGERFADYQDLRVIASDLSRAVETASQVASHAGVEVETDSRLRERAFGDWEGMAFSDFNHHVWSSPDPFGFQPPNGESGYEVWDRLGAFFEDLVLERDTLLVTHGGAAALAVARLVRGRIETSRSFRFANCGVYELERSPTGYFVLTTLNCTRHLATPAMIGDLHGSR